MTLRKINIGTGSLALFLASQAFADGAAGHSEGMPRSTFALEPGEYVSSIEEVGLDVPGVTPIQLATLRDAMMEGAAVENRFCVSPGQPLGSWMSDLVESDCTLMSFFVEHDIANLEFACRSVDGIDGPLQVSGIARAEGVDTMLHFVDDLGAAGLARLQMQVLAHRVGDCAS